MFSLPLCFLKCSLFYLFGIVHSITHKGSSKHVSHGCFDFFIITNKGKGKTDIILTNLTRQRLFIITNKIPKWKSFNMVLCIAADREKARWKDWHLSLHMWPFKWKLLSSTFMWYCILGGSTCTGNFKIWRHSSENSSENYMYGAVFSYSTKHSHSTPSTEGFRIQPPALTPLPLHHSPCPLQQPPHPHLTRNLSWLL